MPHRRRHLAAAGALAVALVVTAAGLQTASAVGGPQRDDPGRTAAIQAALDRVLGPGAAVVTVTDLTSASSSVQTRQRYGAAVAARTSSSSLQGGGATTRSSAQQNLVDQTVTTSSTPQGQLLRQSVAVAVDRSRLGTTSVAAVKRLVAAAADIRSVRGDTLVVLPVARFAAAPVVARPAGFFDRLQPLTLPAEAAAVGSAALALLVGAVRRRKRASS